jgi:hypothetical protein
MALLIEGEPSGTTNLELRSKSGSHPASGIVDTQADQLRVLEARGNTGILEAFLKFYSQK